MNELICLLNYNNVNYNFCNYGFNTTGFIIKKNNYSIEISLDIYGDLFSILKKLPYRIIKIGNTTIENIIYDLKYYLKIDIKNLQLKLF